MISLSILLILCIINFTKFNMVNYFTVSSIFSVTVFGKTNDGVCTYPMTKENVLLKDGVSD